MGKGMTLHVFLESSCTCLNIYCISLLHICAFLGSSAVVFHNVYYISVLRNFSEPQVHVVMLIIQHLVGYCMIVLYTQVIMGLWLAKFLI